MRYKTHRQLKITRGERKWLIETARTLAGMTLRDQRRIDGTSMKFNMSEVFDVIRGHRGEVQRSGGLCGTAGCIMGWMASKAVASGHARDLGIDTKSRDVLDVLGDWGWSAAPWDYSEVLNPLFYPHAVGEEDWSKITPRRAARVIRRFLATGEVHWK